MIGDKVVAEDIVHDVFLKFFQNVDKIKSKEKINFWLFTTARNEIYGFYRSRKIRLDQFNFEDSDSIEIESAENIEDELDKKEINQIINTELNSIPFEQKEVFILKEYGGLSYKAIAALLETNEELVKSRLYKVRQKLIKRISNLYN
jgi:RNA polymerase sigma-70 factor (ECF subfamily)